MPVPRSCVVGWGARCDRKLARPSVGHGGGGHRRRWVRAPSRRGTVDGRNCRRSRRRPAHRARRPWRDEPGQEHCLVQAVALGGVVVVGTVAVRYLNPDQEETSVAGQVEAIKLETSQRSTGGGSELQPVPVNSPADWPFAIERTLLRPAPWEINSLATTLPGIESAILVGILLVGWRRLLSLPSELMRSPYLAGSLVTVLGFGFAFSTIGNLGILVRQRSLIFPLMLLLWALPVYRRAVSRRPQVVALREPEFSW